MVLQRTLVLRRYDILACSGLLRTYWDHSFHGVHRDEIRSILFSEDVPYPSSSCPSRTEDVVSTLSSRQKLAPIQKRSQLTRPCHGTSQRHSHLVCDPNQPHQLSPLGSVPWSMEDADTTYLHPRDVCAPIPLSEMITRFLLMSFVRFLSALPSRPMRCVEET